MTSRKVAIACVLVLGALGPVRSAVAQDAKVKKIEDRNRAAMEDYDILDFESAKKQLQEALVLVKQGKLDKHTVAAKTHLYLGIVLLGMKDADTALLELIAALEIDAAIKLPVAYKTPELQKLFESAKATTSDKGTPPPDGDDGDDGGDDGGDVVGLQHAPLDEARGGKAIPIMCKVGSDVGANQVILFYRPAGAEEFKPVTMKSSGGVTYKAKIPKEATAGDTLHYYIEARSAAGKVMAGYGNSGSPTIITINHPSGGGTGGGVDDEDPLAGVKGGGGGKGGGGKGGDGGDGGDGGGDRIGITKTGAPVGKHRVFIGVALGSGGAFVTGKTESAKQPVNCCFAPEWVHVSPEIGFWITPKITLSIYGRVGLPLGANIPGHAPVGPAGFLRVGYTPGTPGKGGLAIHGDLGGGLIRQTIKLDQETSVGGDVDTHATGPLLAGGGVGWTKPLGGPMRFFVDTNLIVGIPITEALGKSIPQFGVSLDANLGIALAF